MYKLLLGGIAIFLMILIALKLPILFLVYLAGICILGGFSSIKDKQIPFAIFEFIVALVMLRILIAIIKWELQNP